MVYLNRLYTRAGDKGETSLGDGARVPKTSRRIAAMASIDEVNAAIGLACAAADDAALKTLLVQLQNDLFEVGAELCLPDEPPRITAGWIAYLEGRIDEATSQRPALTTFILPGGTPAAASLHLARTIARRAEIQLLGLSETETVNSQTLVYMNRLSDLLFALARLANPLDKPEAKWKPSEHLENS